MAMCDSEKTSVGHVETQRTRLDRGRPGRSTRHSATSRVSSVTFLMTVNV